MPSPGVTFLTIAELRISPSGTENSKVIEAPTGGGVCSVDEEASDIQIADARDALRAVMLPGDPDAFRRRDARVAAVALRWSNQRS